MSDQLKRQAALHALDEIRDGMIVGLGTGSTAAHFIRELGRVRLQVAGIPTSEESRRLAEETGIRLTSFEENPRVDVTVDGADEVSPQLDLLKGLCPALIRPPGPESSRQPAPRRAPANHHNAATPLFAHASHAQQHTSF